MLFLNKDVKNIPFTIDFPDSKIRGKIIVQYYCNGASFQGIFIFMFFVVRKPDIVDYWREKVSQMSTIRSSSIIVSSGEASGSRADSIRKARQKGYEIIIFTQIISSG